MQKEVRALKVNASLEVTMGDAELKIRWWIQINVHMNSAEVAKVIRGESEPTWGASSAATLLEWETESR